MTCLRFFADDVVLSECTETIFMRGFVF